VGTQIGERRRAAATQGGGGGVCVAVGAELAHYARNAIERDGTQTIGRMNEENVDDAEEHVKGVDEIDGRGEQLALDNEKEIPTESKELTSLILRRDRCVAIAAEQMRKAGLELLKENGADDKLFLKRTQQILVLNTQIEETTQTTSAAQTGRRAACHKRASKCGERERTATTIATV
jgi:hypothetical protein